MGLFLGHFTREDLATFCRSQIISNYAIPRSPNLLSHVLAFIPACLFMRRKETDPLATAPFNENRRKEWQNQLYQKDSPEHLVWKESRKESYSNLISWLHIWLPTSFQKSGNNQEKGNNRRNWFPTPFPGSKTFQLYKEPKPWLNSL